MKALSYFLYFKLRKPQGMILQGAYTPLNLNE